MVLINRHLVNDISISDDFSNNHCKTLKSTKHLYRDETSNGVMADNQSQQQHNR